MDVQFTAKELEWINYFWLIKIPEFEYLILTLSWHLFIRTKQHNHFNWDIEFWIRMWQKCNNLLTFRNRE